MNMRSLLSGSAALLALAALSGCGGDAPSLSSEMDDSYYRDGQEMQKQGRWDEALADYLKVIDRRGDSAPESNLDAGLIYLNHNKNPIFAIYHFSKYLELEPNSKQAGLVRGMINSAKREFVRSLPGQPLASETERMGIEEQVERLQRENNELKAENESLRAGVPVPATHSSSLDLGALPTPESLAQAPSVSVKSPDSPISLAPVTTADAGASSPAIEDASQESTPAAPTHATKPAPAAAVRHHAVVKGDTLFSLAQKYYGNRSRWRDIYTANRGLLSSEHSALKIGMDLRIP
jgi:tetratricopeptide (TPR) repeat protein